MARSPEVKPQGAADPELDRLLEHAQRGDPDAWRGLVDRLRRLVYSIPVRYGLNNAEADDVFLITFSALHRNLDRIEGGRALPSWLARTATRESLGIRRLKDRTASLPLEEVVATEDATAEGEAVRSDDAFRVRRALAKMAARCRDLLEALFFTDEEVAYDEVARRLRIPIGTIGPTRSRCLDKLRRMLEAEGFSA